jgi:hypothetical protein
MAAKAETLTTAPLTTGPLTTVTPHVGSPRRDLVARMATAVKAWGRKGQLGNATSEMRRYTGSR